MNDSYGTRSLREIVRIVFQHWFMMLFIVVLGTAGTYAVCQYVAPVYESTVSLMFKRPLSKSPISTDQGERALEVFVKAQQQIVMSDLVLARAKVISEDPVLRKRWGELRERWESARSAGRGSVAEVQGDIGDFLRRDVGSRVQKLLEEGQSELKEFEESVKLETPGGEQVAMTESFTLTARRPSQRDDPESCKNAMYVADTLADMYMVRYQELQQTLSDPALRVMQDVINAFEREVKADLDRYGEFVQTHSADIGVLEQLLKSGTEHGTQVVLTKVRENDATLVLELARDRAVFEVMKAQLPVKAFEPGGIEEMTGVEVEDAVASISVEFLQDNVGFAELVKEQAKLEAKRAQIEAQYTEESRDVRYLRQEVLEGKRQLLRSIVAHARGLEAGIKAREQQKIRSDQLVKETTAEQDEIHKKLAEYAQLKNSFLVAQKHIEELQQEKLDAMSDQMRARESVTITKLDQASVPDVNRPVTPKTLIYTVVAFVVSSLLGVAGAFLADHFDHTLRSAIEAERYLGVPVLGSVKKRGRRLVVGM
ncbi:MAG: hypothetical protein JXQ75_15915 [Phycisphaerae bacterium]|nr:hypothetical protein [Phycisphaerae bacterium]